MCGDFETIEEAKAQLGQPRSYTIEWWHIVDLHTGKMVEDDFHGVLS